MTQRSQCTIGVFNTQDSTTACNGAINGGREEGNICGYYRSPTSQRTYVEGLAVPEAEYVDGLLLLLLLLLLRCGSQQLQLLQPPLLPLFDGGQLLPDCSDKRDCYCCCWSMMACSCGQDEGADDEPDELMPDGVWQIHADDDDGDATAEDGAEVDRVALVVGHRGPLAGRAWPALEGQVPVMIDDPGDRPRLYSYDGRADHAEKSSCHNAHNYTDVLLSR